jgi:hypothetical protein
VRLESCAISGGIAVNLFQERFNSVTSSLAAWAITLKSSSFVITFRGAERQGRGYPRILAQARNRVNWRTFLRRVSFLGQRSFLSLQRLRDLQKNNIPTKREEGRLRRPSSLFVGIFKACRSLTVILTGTEGREVERQRAERLAKRLREMGSHPRRPTATSRSYARCKSRTETNYFTDPAKVDLSKWLFRQQPERLPAAVGVLPAAVGALPAAVGALPAAVGALPAAVGTPSGCCRSASRCCRNAFPLLSERLPLLSERLPAAVGSALNEDCTNGTSLLSFWGDI